MGGVVEAGPGWDALLRTTADHSKSPGGDRMTSKGGALNTQRTWENYTRPV